MVVRNLESVLLLTQQERHRLAEAFLKPVRPGQVEDGERVAGLGVREFVLDLPFRKSVPAQPLVQGSERGLLLGILNATRDHLGWGCQLFGHGSRLNRRRIVKQVVEERVRRLS